MASYFDKMDQGLCEAKRLGFNANPDDSMKIIQVMTISPEELRHFPTSTQYDHGKADFEDFKLKLFLEEKRLMGGFSSVPKIAAILAKKSNDNLKCFNCNKLRHYAREYIVSLKRQWNKNT